MTPGALFWLVVFGIFGGLFFGIAVVVSLLGGRDLRDLLGASARKGDRR